MVLLICLFIFCFSSLNAITIHTKDFDLKIESNLRCDPIKFPPRPQCSHLPSSVGYKDSVGIAIWRQDTASLEVPGFCLTAHKITRSCSYKYYLLREEKIIKSEVIDIDKNSIPTRDTLISLQLSSHPRTISGEDTVPCFWPSQNTITTHILSGKACSMRVTKAGLILSPQFPNCVLKNNVTCVGKNKQIFVQGNEVTKFTDCPVSLNSIDVGVIESTTIRGKDKGPADLIVSSDVMKQLFFWKLQNSTPPVHLCVHQETSLKVYEDDGGYLISVIFMEKGINDLSDIVIKWKAKSSNAKRNFSEVSQFFSSGIMHDLKRPKREAISPRPPMTWTELRELILKEAGEFDYPISNTRPKREVLNTTSVHTSLGGVTSLQRSLARSEYQWGFHSLINKMAGTMEPYGQEICHIKIQLWEQLSTNNMKGITTFLTPEPGAFLRQTITGTELCVPMLITGSESFELHLDEVENNHWIRVSQDNKTIGYLENFSGIIKLSTLSVVEKQGIFKSFYIPLKSGCSYDLSDNSISCPDHFPVSDISALDYLFHLPPLYSLQDMSNLVLNKVNSEYQVPLVYKPTENQKFLTGLAGDSFINLVEPLSAIIYSTSRNLWTWVYLILVVVVLIKISLFVVHYRLKILGSLSFKRNNKAIGETTYERGSSDKEIGLHHFSIH
ncbi:glycoprotein [Agrotis ipsilon virus]|nr:glycoprotein [Agrotis ipsilon virus]